MEVQKGPFQEESSLSAGVCAQTHVSWWELAGDQLPGGAISLEPRGLAAAGAVEGVAQKLPMFRLKRIPVETF